MHSSSWVTRLSRKESQIDPLEDQIHPMSLDGLLVPQRLMKKWQTMYDITNHEKINEKILCILRMVNQTRPPWKDANTYQSLDVEEKHPDNPMTRMVELEEAH